jgi:hypothetical protein
MFEFLDHVGLCRELRLARAPVKAQNLELPRALARKDLVELFGNPGHALVQEREFAKLGADLFWVPATQERLRRMFAKR